MVLRVGIAGFGVVGRRRKQCVDDRTDLDVVAVCDQSFDTSGVLDDGTRFHPTLTGVFSEDLDVLIVCLPNNIAPDVTVEGL